MRLGPDADIVWTPGAELLPAAGGSCERGTNRRGRPMSTEHPHPHAHPHDHDHSHDHGHAHTQAPSGFKYFLPGLIVGFIIGAVVGVVLPEMRGGGPRLDPAINSGQPRVHDEEERMKAGQLPQTPEEAPTDANGDAIPDAPADSTGTTAPDAPKPDSGGH